MNLFVGISIILVLATVMAGIMAKFKQPIIIGHILTGLIIGPFLLRNQGFGDMIDIFSQFGIALLLFIIGLNLSPKVIKEVGKTSFIVGLGQVTFTAILAFLLNSLLGMGLVASVFLSIALTFSSTIIILKLLSDKQDLGKLYSKIAVGLLLLQDLVVTIILIGISAFSGNHVTWESVLFLVLKGIVSIDLLVLFTVYLLPKITVIFAKSQEFLFLFSIGWGLGFATLFYYLGFSIEIGALIAGIALSTSVYHHEISSRLHPVRDFFIVLFFILLGSKISLPTIVSSLPLALTLSAFVLIIKPLIVLILMGLLGYRKKTSFLTALTVGQISEFSLVLLLMAEKSGQISTQIVSVFTLVGLITIAGSTYMVLFSNYIFNFLSPVLSIFERKLTRSDSTHSEKYEVILFGCNRVGPDFIESFRDLGEKFLVVDFNPEVIEHLKALNINSRYGDADDNEFLEELGLQHCKMIISTIPDFDTNEFLIGRIKQCNEKAIVIVISHSAEDAIGLYESGATYVITPHFLGGKFASMLISKYGFDVEKFIGEKEKHLKDLQKHKSFDELEAISA